MNVIWLTSSVALWLVVFFLGILLWGALQALGRLRWRLEQLEATTPNRVGRNGLRAGRKAPDFTLPDVDGNPVSLHDFLGRKVLLVFTQAGCSPCRDIVPELNRLQTNGDVFVLVVNNSDRETVRQWSVELQACFPVLAQERFTLSRRYEVFATPFAFLIDEHGVIASKGLSSNGQHLRFVLAGDGASSGHAEEEPAGTDAGSA
jgi:methylamine dehydrogenase accessory protein MauD